MKRLAFILLLLTACSREDKPKEPGLFPGSGPTLYTPDPPTVKMTVAFAGQSNIVASTGLSDPFNTDKIQCAVGGSYIAEWQRGQALYENCLAKMKQANPGTMVWWQGEADAHEMALTITWKPRFERMVTDMRADLGYPIRIIYVQLGDRASGEMAGPIWQEMRKQQASVAIPNAKMVDVTFADQYRKINSDGNIDVHYTPEGYQAIGQKLAYIYLEGL